MAELLTDISREDFQQAEKTRCRLTTLGDLIEVGSAIETDQIDYALGMLKILIDYERSSVA